LTADLGAPVLRVFAGWSGVTASPANLAAADASERTVGRYDIARRHWAALHDEFPPEYTWDLCRSGLVEAAGWAADAGITLALQNHPPVIENRQDMLRMIREVASPAMKACYDAPLARRQGETDIRRAVHDVGALQVLSHFGGEYDRGPDRGAWLRA